MIHFFFYIWRGLKGSRIRRIVRPKLRHVFGIVLQRMVAAQQRCWKYSVLSGVADESLVAYILLR